MGKIIITIEVPEGVTPDVHYGETPQNAPEPAQEAQPAPWEGWNGSSAPAQPSAPTGKPECPQHHKGRQRKTGAWFCPTPIEKDELDNVVKWCPWKP